MVIKHLVLSGGATWGLTAYGSLKQSEKYGIWSINNIKTMYATSVGSIIATMLSLKYDWETLDDFLIMRPWQQVFPFNLYSAFFAFENNGFFHVEHLRQLFLPLFQTEINKIKTGKMSMVDIS